MMPTESRLCAHAALFALTLLGIAGCTLPNAPAPRFYTLSASADGAGALPTVRSAVAVGPVTIPDLVDRPQLVLRGGTNRVLIVDEQRWAEPLRLALPRLIADDLGRLLPGTRVFELGERAGGEPALRVLVDLRRFDSVADQSATVEALWSVRRIADGQTRAGRTLAQEKVSAAGYDALVQAHSRAMARVAADIAQALRTLEDQAPAAR